MLSNNFLSSSTSLHCKFQGVKFTPVKGKSYSFGGSNSLRGRNYPILRVKITPFNNFERGKSTLKSKIFRWVKLTPFKGVKSGLKRGKIALG